MTLGLAPRQADLFSSTAPHCERRVAPPMIVAVVMVLQRIEGYSDREAVDRFAFDARWKYAAGGLDFGIRGSGTRCWWICRAGWPGRRGRTG